MTTWDRPFVEQDESFHSSRVDRQTFVEKNSLISFVLVDPNEGRVKH